jgi:hypothetical protein
LKSDWRYILIELDEKDIRAMRIMSKKAF